MAAMLEFDDAATAGAKVTFPADPQTAVEPGDAADTAVVVTPDGKRFLVKGDYRDVQLKVQAASARSHESGDAPKANTSVS